MWVSGGEAEKHARGWNAGGSPQVTVSTMRFGCFPALVGRDRTDFQHLLYRIAGAFRFLYHRSTNSAYNATGWLQSGVIRRHGEMS